MFPSGASGLVLNFVAASATFRNNGTITATNGGLRIGRRLQSVPKQLQQHRHADAARQQHGQPATIAIISSISPTARLTGGTYNVTGTLLIPGNITTNAAKITLTGKARRS